jgi:hypothetical protein
VRQKLKIQFAKYDNDHDGFLNVNECVVVPLFELIIRFTTAFRSCSRLLLNLAKVPVPVATQKYHALALPRGLDINGFILVGCVCLLKVSDTRPWRLSMLRSHRVRQRTTTMVLAP